MRPRPRRRRESPLAEGLRGSPVLSSPERQLLQRVPRGTVDPSPIIACVGLIDDVRTPSPWTSRGAGDPIYLIGPRSTSWGDPSIIGRSGELRAGTYRWSGSTWERSMIYAAIDSIAEKKCTSSPRHINGGLRRPPPRWPWWAGVTWASIWTSTPRIGTPRRPAHIQRGLGLPFGMQGGVRGGSGADSEGIRP